MRYLGHMVSCYVNYVNSSSCPGDRDIRTADPYSKPDLLRLMLRDLSSTLGTLRVLLDGQTDQE